MKGSLLKDVALIGSLDGRYKPVYLKSIQVGINSLLKNLAIVPTIICGYAELALHLVDTNRSAFYQPAKLPVAIVQPEY